MRPGKSYDDLLRRAQDALDDENFDEAEALGRRALMLRPDSPDARQVIASSLIEQARYEEAVVLLDEILGVDPDDLAALADLGLCHFEMCAFEDAEAALSRALEVDQVDPQASYWMGLCVERRAEFRMADEFFRQAHTGDPESYPLPTRIAREEFDAAMRESIEELPDEIRSALVNLSIMVQDLPTDDDLVGFDPPMDPCVFGLYVGVPLPERRGHDVPRLPDNIYVYQRNLERMCPDRETLVNEIRITLLHEVGHYLGFDEQDLEERGLA